MSIKSICALFGILVIVMSCHKDDFNSLPNNNSMFNLTIVSKNNFKHKDNVLKKLKQISPEESGLEKQIYNPIYDFTVNTDYVKYVENKDGSIHSYTFPISREKNQNTENLVLTFIDNKYNAEIISYKFNDNDKLEIKSAQLKNFNADDYVPSYGGFSYSCETTVTYDSSYNADCSCVTVMIIDVSTTCDYTYTISPLSGGGGGGGGNSNGMSNTVWVGGNSNNNSGNGNTITTTVTSPIIQDHLTALKAQTSHPLIKARMEKMKNDLDNVLKEQGSEFIKTSTGYEEYRIPDNKTYFSGTEFPKALKNSEVRVHSHHNGTYIDYKGETKGLAPIFSLEDIFGMSNFYMEKKSLNKMMLPGGNISSILVSKRGFYALRVTDANKVVAFYNSISNHSEQGKASQDYLKEMFARNVIERTRLKCGDECDNNKEEALFEYYFKKFFKNLDSGMSLFYCPNLYDSNGNYIWEFVTN